MKPPGAVPREARHWMKWRQMIVTIASVIVVVLICWVSFFHGLGLLYPLDKTEALQLSLADSMAASGNWVTPSIDGLPYFDKPPLPYWIGAGLLHLAPGAVWLPRVGSAMAGSLGVLVTILLVLLGSRDCSRPQRLGRAAMAGVILALMPGYLAFSRIAVHDIYLTVSIASSLTVFFLFSQRSSITPGLQLAAGGTIGLALGTGVLAKGLMSLGLPLAVAAAFLWITAAPRRRFLNWRFGLALLLSLAAVALPWHLAAWHEQGEVFLQNYLVRTHFHRLTTELDAHAAPWFFYALVYPALTAPWGIPALLALVQADGLDPRHWRRRAQSEPLPVFCVIWIAVTLVLLSLASTKLPHYILSSIPPTAILAAYFFCPGRVASQVAGSHRCAASDRASRWLLITTAGVLLVTATLLATVPSLLIPISSKAPAFSIELRSLLGSTSMIAGLIFLGAACFLAALRCRERRLVLAGLWAACITGFLLFQAPPVMQAYRHTVQDPRLAIADLALHQLRRDEALEVVGKAWYSIKLSTHGQAEILNRGKAFGLADQQAPDLVCDRPGLIMGPIDAVEQISARCRQGSLKRLLEERTARIELARWTPSNSSARLGPGAGS